MHPTILFSMPEEQSHQAHKTMFHFARWSFEWLGHIAVALQKDLIPEG